MRRFWTVAELDLLRSMYPHCHGEDVAAWLQRSLKSIYMAAKEHGLRKSPEYLASDTACRIQRGKVNPNMMVTRFKAGMTPWNKGVKGATGTHENCRKTQFRPGRRPEESRNYRPIGSHRITRDGMPERKVSDDQSVYPARRWVAVPRLVWEAQHGPIPAGHIVVFKPSMATTDPALVTLDRIECITRAENARRNHPRTRSPELARLVQLKGAITRQVNRIAREAKAA